MEDKSISIERIILGSSSQFRAQLLKQTGLEFHVEASDVNEALVTHDMPCQLALLRAEAKALGVRSLRNKGSLVLGSDQVVELDGTAYGKVESKEEAFKRLALFSGKTHQLHSAYALYCTDGAGQLVKCALTCVTATIELKKLSEDDIHAYLDFDEWQGSSACYYYEGRGINLFKRVEGDYSTIIGLPITDLLNDLNRLGINSIRNPTGPWTIKV